MLQSFSLLQVYMHLNPCINEKKIQIIDVYGKMHKILIPQNSEVQINGLKWILSPFWTLSHAMNTDLLQYTS